MSKRPDAKFLIDAKESIVRIEDYIKELDYAAFLHDIKTQDAVLRNLEIIGEAVKNISSHFKNKHKDIEWKRLAGLRDKIIHYYFGVNWSIVWDVIKNRLPELKGKFEAILKEIEG
jgi:uncharacterized protein with HEPN domain